MGQLLVLHPEGTKLGWAGGWLPSAVTFTALWSTWDSGGVECRDLQQDWGFIPSCYGV